MEEQVFKYHETKLHYLKTGKGLKPLLIFHGFGQDKDVFLKLSPALSENYTLYIFDLFFHGKSEWNKGERPLEKSFWKGLLIEFLKRNQIDRFSLLGFSMGGKFALASLEAFPKKIDNVFLLAPDGIKTSMWYWLATYPVAVRHLFKSMVLKPKRFQFIASLANKLGLIDKRILRFVESQMNTEEKRKQVYNSWVVFRHLEFNLSRIATLINSNNIKLTLVIGKYDEIITVKNMSRLLKKLKKYSLEIPETGHNGVIAASIQKL